MLFLYFIAHVIQLKFEQLKADVIKSIIVEKERLKEI